MSNTITRATIEEQLRGQFEAGLNEAVEKELEERLDRLSDELPEQIEEELRQQFEAGLNKAVEKELEDVD